MMTTILMIFCFIFYQLFNTIIYNDNLKKILFLDKEKVLINNLNDIQLVNITNNYICIDYVEFKKINEENIKKDNNAEYTKNEIKKYMDLFMNENKDDIYQLSKSFINSYSNLENDNVKFKNIKDKFRYPFSLFTKLYQKRKENIDNGIIWYIDTIFNNVDNYFLNLNFTKNIYTIYPPYPIFYLTNKTKYLNNIDNIMCINTGREFWLSLYRDHLSPYLEKYS
jgi:hypothetical protein